MTEVVDIEGLRVTLVDTAGLRDTDDPVELEGVARARQAMTVADLVLLVEDRSRPRSREDLASLIKVLYVANKSRPGAGLARRSQRCRCRRRQAPASHELRRAIAGGARCRVRCAIGRR